MKLKRWSLLDEPYSSTAAVMTVPNMNPETALFPTWLISVTGPIKLP